MTTATDPAPPRHGPIRLGIVGIGKIARDQHVPAIMANPAFVLAATADPHGSLDGVPAFGDFAAMLAGMPDLDAVAICTPPGLRAGIATAAIDAGLAVLLEKPTAATLAQAEGIVAHAAASGTPLMATWHSREAAAVAEARGWIAERQVAQVTITWKEDIRRWHPGQEWILAANGFGVFDPGINALSILTEILPDPVRVETAHIAIPEGRAAPIAARLALVSGDARIAADFDFLQTGPQSWDIRVDTDRGTLVLSDGGATIAIDGEAPRRADNGEYRALYARFAQIVADGTSDADLAPLRLVEDAIRVAEREVVAPFAF
ncbi:Gfo/Idh/MocA family oxidoreductase [Sphingomonas sp. TREG-RG-20F-R18-01]|uniref:Gfo/Idh/MocA family protein n=1 Tax=Sphingomonas sp. TREG-RG-20F-R18-01 TaxID=2914982 RepID=UPI001F5670B3|nr:Gfo/Idh/MocA family oxidoreductase [Sphingomonas sp. TREG-RG-20F-R18-01]